MPEKLTRKEKIALQKSSGNIPKSSVNKPAQKNSIKRTLGLICALAGFLLYMNTTGNDYVLDDFGLVKENTSVHKGIKAIPEIFSTSYRFGMNITDFNLYRPLSKAMFAIEWQIAPNNPALSHFVNIIFFSISCLLLFRFLCMCFKDNLLVPFITTLIFAAHPMHTEVVANIKSRDEIICFLLCIASTMSFMKYAINSKSKFLMAGILWYFLALLTKESAITFCAIIPLVLYFFTDTVKSKYFNVIISMLIASGIFLILHHKILGNTIALIPVEDNSLLGIKNVIVQRANAIYILGVYMMKMIVPTPLISDASYNSFPPVGLASWKFLLPFVILIAGFIFAMLKFKKKDPVSFAILFFFVTVSIVSNVIILIGTNYGERLMYVPSVGICLGLAILISKLLQTEKTEERISSVQLFLKRNNKSLALVVIIFILFGYKTMARNTEWKNNFTLYMTDIKNVPNSAHMLFYIANHITSEDELALVKDSNEVKRIEQEGINYLTKAVTIFPQYADGYQRRGFIYNALNDQKHAEEDYIEALKYNPTHPIVYNNYGTLCFKQQRYEDAKHNFEQAIRYNPNYAHALSNLASVYGVYGEGEREMIQKDPANSATHQKQSQENFETAIDFFLRSIKCDPDFVDPYRMLFMTYMNIGDDGNASRYQNLFNQALARKNAKG